MDRAIVVRGRLTSPTDVHLEEPVGELGAAVEVTIRPVPAAIGRRLLDVARARVGNRSKGDIDAALRRERQRWDR